MSADESDQNEKKSFTAETLDWESRQNLTGFFMLLWEVDKRLHPERYKNPNLYE